MTHACRRALATAAVCGWLLTPAVAGADTWSEQTRLTFSEPVMIPGHTLEPGTYVFRIADVTSARHVFRVRSETDNRVVASIQAIPMKRAESTNDIVLKFAPTSGHEAPALKGFFYPGRLYGHEFVYPDDEARQIAARTKTLVLSTEGPADDARQGTLHAIDAAGLRTPWREDPQVSREWSDWQHARAASTGRSDDQQAADRSQASLIQADFKGMRVSLDQLEKDPDKYIGQQVSVDGEVDDVLGPRVFKIDEPNWGDLDGELLVIVPAGLAALIGEDDRVTVSGTVRRFASAELEREWGWQATPEVEVRLSSRPVIVAQRIVGGDDQRAMIIRVPEKKDTPVGTSGLAGIGVAGSRAMTDSTALAAGDDELVGRTVDLKDVKVSGVDGQRGFFIGPRERQLFVLTHDSATETTPRVGQNVSIDGFVMQMPSGMPGDLAAPGALNRHIYVYATAVD
ncbi:MAG: hypothetical protein AB7H96_13710 [Vicinamibacterales bacterium]